jgi:hypothetical protein
MTDIVEQLRHIMEAGTRPIPPSLVLKAADEIERLRIDAIDIEVELRTEIEQLSTDNVRLREDHSDCVQSNRFHCSEITRLRAALQDMIEISCRNSSADLMLVAIRKCAQHALSFTAAEDKP